MKERDSSVDISIGQAAGRPVLKCACMGKLGGGVLCPVCYNGLTVFRAYIPAKTTGQILTAKLRLALIKLAVATGPDPIDGRRRVAGLIGITDQTLTRALKGGAISFPIIRRMLEVKGLEKIDIKDACFSYEPPLAKKYKDNRPEPLYGTEVRVEGTLETQELGEKHLYLPGLKVTARCPYCNELASADFRDRYLNYPAVGKPFELNLYCHSKKCNDDTFEPAVTVTVKLNITLSIADQPATGERQ